MEHCLKSCNQENMSKFISALRSDEFKQGMRRLGVIQEDIIYYCCLGVACKTAINNGIMLQIDSNFDDILKTNIESFDEERAILPLKVRNWLGLCDNNPMLSIPNYLQRKLCLIYIYDGSVCSEQRATALNDAHNFTFAEIADCFEHTYIRNLDE